jgi:hypothetical protein
MVIAPSFIRHRIFTTNDAALLLHLIFLNRFATLGVSDSSSFIHASPSEPDTVHSGLGNQLPLRTHALINFKLRTDISVPCVRYETSRSHSQIDVQAAGKRSHSDHHGSSWDRFGALSGLPARAREAEIHASRSRSNAAILRVQRPRGRLPVQV